MGAAARGSDAVRAGRARRRRLPRRHRSPAGHAAGATVGWRRSARSVGASSSARCPSSTASRAPRRCTPCATRCSSGSAATPTSTLADPVPAGRARGRQDRPPAHPIRPPGPPSRTRRRSFAGRARSRTPIDVAAFAAELAEALGGSTPASSSSAGHRRRTWPAPGVAQIGDGRHRCAAARRTTSRSSRTATSHLVYARSTTVDGVEPPGAALGRPRRARRRRRADPEPGRARARAVGAGRRSQPPAR